MSSNSMGMDMSSGTGKSRMLRTALLVPGIVIGMDMNMGSGIDRNSDISMNMNLWIETLTWAQIWVWNRIWHQWWDDLSERNGLKAAQLAPGLSLQVSGASYCQNEYTNFRRTQNCAAPSKRAVAGDKEAQPTCVLACIPKELETHPLLSTSVVIINIIILIIILYYYINIWILYYYIILSMIESWQVNCTVYQQHLMHRV